MKNAKKKLPLIIGLSSAVILLGGLVFVGISSFPDLLKSDEELAEAKETSPVNNNRLVVEEEPLFESEPVIVSGVSGNYAPASYNDNDVEFISVSANSETSVNVSSSSKKSNHIIEEHPVFHEEVRFDDFAVTQATSIVNEPVVANENGNLISHVETKEDNVSHQISATKKAVVNKNRSVRSNEAVVETSLLVVGAVDLLSVVLIKRKKHLFR